MYRYANLQNKIFPSYLTYLKYHNFLKVSFQSLSTLVSWDPSVSKFNQLHVDIFQVFFIGFSMFPIFL